MPTRLAVRDDAFDRYVDEQNTVEVQGIPLRASDALATDPDGYDTALQAWRQQREDELIARVLTEFPQPIAVRFHRHQRGANRPREKLDHLRDTWEAVITVYAALLLGEIRARGAPCSTLGVDASRLTFHNLRQPIDLVARLLASPLDLRTTTFMRSAQRERLVEIMRTLNDERNGLAHTETPSDAECRRLLDGCRPLVLEALALLEPFADCKFVSFADHEDDLVFQLFRGKGTERDLDTIPLSPEQRSTVLSLPNPKGHVVALWEQVAFVMSPMIRWYEGENGHQPLLAFLDNVSTEKGSLRYQTFGNTDVFETNAPTPPGFHEHIGRHATLLLAEHEALRALFRTDPAENARAQAHRRADKRRISSRMRLSN